MDTVCPDVKKERRCRSHDLEWTAVCHRWARCSHIQLDFQALGLCGEVTSCVGKLRANKQTNSFTHFQRHKTSEHRSAWSPHSSENTGLSSLAVSLPVSQPHTWIPVSSFVTLGVSLRCTHWDKHLSCAGFYLTRNVKKLRSQKERVRAGKPS